MNCNSIQDKILSSNDGKWPSDVQAHLETCPECRLLAEEWDALRDLDLEPETVLPITAEFVIKREARHFVENRRATSQAWLRWSKLAATAACVMVVSWIVLKSVNELSPSPAPQPDGPQVPSQQLAKQGTDAAKTPDWADINMNNQLVELATDIEFNQAFLRIGTDTETSEVDLQPALDALIDLEIPNSDLPEDSQLENDSLPVVTLNFSQSTPWV